MKFACRMNFHLWRAWATDKPRSDRNKEIQRRECFHCGKAQSRTVL